MYYINKEGIALCLGSFVGTLFLLFVLYTFHLEELENKKNLELVKSGAMVLTCYIGHNPNKIINPEKVVGYQTGKGGELYWEFTNGYAKRCNLERKG